MTTQMFKIYADSKLDVPCKKELNLFQIYKSFPDDDLSINVPERLFKDQDENGNISLLKGIWEFNFNTNIILQNDNVANNYFCKLNPKIFVNNFEKNDRSNPVFAGYGSDFYFQTTIRVKLPNETNLVKMTLFPEIIYRKISDNAMTTLKSITLLGTKIADLS